MFCKGKSLSLSHTLFFLSLVFNKLCFIESYIISPSLRNSEFTFKGDIRKKKLGKKEDFQKGDTRHNTLNKFF